MKRLFAILFCGFCFSASAFAGDGDNEDQGERHPFEPSEETSPFDGQPYFPIEDTINRALVTSMPMLFTTFGGMMAYGHWSPLDYAAAGGVATVGTILNYQRNFRRSTPRLSIQSSAASLGVGFATVTCAALLGMVIP